MSEAPGTLVATFEVGGTFSDFSFWEIRKDLELSLSRYGYDKPCPHCTNLRTEKHKTAYGEELEGTLVTFPRVVIAYNEGGHCWTGVCLDCILEKANALV